MANNYYNFPTPFVPGTKVRSEQVNVQYQGVESGFDLLPTDPVSMSIGTSWLGTDVQGATVNDYLITTPDPQSALANGQRVAFFATHTNDGAATINVDGLGVVNFVSNDGTALGANDLILGQYYEAVYDNANTQFTLSLAAGNTSTFPQITATSPNAIDLVDTNVALRVGAVDPDTTQHIEISGDVIQSKSDATNVGQLQLNEQGGEVAIGNQSGPPTGEGILLYQDGFEMANIDRSAWAFSGAGVWDPAVPDAYEFLLEFYDRDATNFWGSIGWDPATTDMRFQQFGDGGGFIFSGALDSGAAFELMTMDPEEGINFLPDGNSPLFVEPAGVSTVSGAVYLDNGATVYMAEIAAAQVDIGGYGQLWVNSGFTPNRLFYTDETGVDIDLTTVGGSPGGADTNVQFNNAGVFGGNAGFIYDGTDVTLTGALTVGMAIDLTGTMRMLERADHAFTPTATFGELWLRNDGPNVLVFTDDAGTDWDLNVAVTASPWTESGTNLYGGTNAGAALTSGVQNVLGGFNAGTGITTGDDNVLLGIAAGSSLVGSSDNVGIGSGTLDNTATAQRNTAIGKNAGGSVLSGSNDNIFIGSESGPTASVVTNRLYIDIAQTVTPFIGGDMSTGAVELAGTVRFTERADHIGTPAATFGELWLRSDGPNVLVFTDDAGTDFVLNGAGSSGFTFDGSATTGDQIAAVANALLTSGTLLDLSSNLSTFTGSVLKVNQDHASAVAFGIEVQNAGMESGIFINQTGLGVGLEITQDNVGSKEALLITNNVDNNYAIEVFANTANGGALQIQSNVATRTKPLVNIINDNATGAGVIMALRNDQSGDALNVENTNAAGTAARFESNVASRTEPVVEIIQEHATVLGGGHGLYVRNDGSHALVAGIQVDSTGTSPGIIVDKTVTGGFAARFRTTVNNRSTALVSIEDESATGNATNRVALALECNKGAFSDGVVLDFIGTAGGIRFPSTSQPPNAVANYILYDYRRGETTMGVTVGAGTLTLNSGLDSLGWIKIGGFVSVFGLLRINTATTPSGLVQFTGLPYRNFNGGEASYATRFTVYADNLATGVSFTLMGELDEGSTTIRMKDTDGATVNDIGALIQTASDFLFNFTYFTDEG